jgi:alpha-amylase
VRFNPLRLCILVAGGLTVAPMAANAQDLWQGQSIYQIITDRFSNGDVSNDNADGNYNASAGGAVHGGDFKGIQQKLDYIKALGATAIWISPVVKNANGDYHGYAGSDFYNVDPHWGSLTDLQSLIQAAHTKGLLVIDDVVVNHGSQLLNSSDNGYPNFIAPPGGYNLFYRDNSHQYAPPFDPNSGQSLTQLFHNNGLIQDFTNTTQVTLGFLEGLDDFRTESSYVQTNMANIYEFWAAQGFDGFRVDTVKHVDQGFWQAWSPQIHSYAANHGAPNFFMFGEVYDSSETKNASYTGTVNGPNFELDSVLDYPLYFLINPIFGLATGNTKQIEDHYAAVDANYDPSAKMRLVTFLDNHDQPRFLNSLNANNKTARLQVALAFLYTARGIPCLYYGTEQAFNGGADPNNREDMFAGQFEQGPSLGDNFNEVHPLFQLVAKLNNFRRLYPALQTGIHVNQWSDPNGPGLFAYSRVRGTQEVFVALNTSDVVQTLPSRPTTYAAGTVLQNLLNPLDTLVVQSGQQIPSFDVYPSTAKVYIAQSQVLPLNPTVLSITPQHDQSSAPTGSTITMVFSKPMNTASVQAAFSTFPTTTGNFTWSSDSTSMTYQANAPLPSLTTMAVHLGATAAASDGTQFFAPFDSRFTTASQTVTDTTPPTVTITSPHNADVWSPATQITSFQGTASDDVAISDVQISVDGSSWISVFAQRPAQSVQWNQSFRGSLLNGSHTVTARAIDTAGNQSSVASAQFRTAFPPGPFDQRMVAEGSSYMGCDGVYWDSDSPWNYPLPIFPFGYIGGTEVYSTNTISNVCSQGQAVYRAGRYSSTNDSFSYVFDAPIGVYQVTLLNAETIKQGPNQRLFDVYLQGQKVLSSFDIFLQANGANQGISNSFTTTVQNLLTVQFKPIYNEARVSAIHVQKTADLYSDTDGIPDWWRLAYFDHATGLAADKSRASDDADGDGRTNYQEYLAGTNPIDPTSNFQITNIRIQYSTVVVSFQANTTLTYQLQRSPSLISPTWTNVGSPAQASFTPFSFYDSGGANLPSPQFYRVIVAQ